MGITLVTGATGFIGCHLVRALVERGDRVRGLRRATSRGAHLDELGCEWAQGDILDRRSVRRALKGVDRVFHVAGTTNLRLPIDAVFEVNVRGTRAVLEECLRAGVERVVHTSSVAALGPAPRGSTADETQLYTAGHLGIPYVNAKHEAEVEALRLAAFGLPVVIVNPAHVLGPGDRHRSSTDVVRRFMLRRIPAYTDGALNVVDVRDVVAGMLLADEKGVAGERYVLGDRNYTWDRLFADLARLSGVEPPAVRLPAAVAEALAAVPGSPVDPIEVRASAQWWAYRSTKARRELGWRTRAHEDTVEATVAWYREQLGDRVERHGRRQPLHLRVAGFAVKQLTP